MTALFTRGALLVERTGGMYGGRFRSGLCSLTPRKSYTNAAAPAEITFEKNLLSAMNSKVIGHADLKTGVLLGLLANENVYIEGPPGAAKTMLAEISAEATGLTFWFYQMHRDTRIQELVGDAIIHREPCPDGGGEIIRQRNQPGGILTAEISVLDDISRAPGEALNVLLRILNERKFGNDEIPLVTAIATANPSGDQYYTEPLDPANLDRFAVQVQTRGLIQQKSWEEAAAVIDLYANPPKMHTDTQSDIGVCNHAGSIASGDGGDGGDVGGGSGAADDSRFGGDANASLEDNTAVSRSVDQRVAAFDDAVVAVDGIEVPEPIQDLLVTFLQTLIRDHRLTAENSLLTDRTFLVKAVKVIKAHAFLHGRRDAAAPEDLFALQFMTTFRVPAKVHLQVPKVIAATLAEALGTPAHPPAPPKLEPKPPPRTKAEAQARQRESLVGSGLRGSKRGRRNAAAAGIRLPPTKSVPAGMRGPTPTSAASKRAAAASSNRMAALSLEAVKHKPWRQELQIPFQFPGDKKNDRDSHGKKR